jgi:hypothetical protein
MSNQGNDFNQVVLPLRRAVLLAGAQPGLRWWSGDILTPASGNALKTLFPGTGELAGMLVLERSVRRIGAEQRAEGITLFDFTEQHEIVLRQQFETQVRSTELTSALPAFASSADLAAWLSQTFGLPTVQESKWVTNEQRQHATLPDPWAGESSGELNLSRLSLLVSALKLSRPGLFLQPVLTERPLGSA